MRIFMFNVYLLLTPTHLIFNHCLCAIVHVDGYAIITITPKLAYLDFCYSIF